MSASRGKELTFEQVEQQRLARIDFLETMKQTVSEWRCTSMDSTDSDADCYRHIQRAAATHPKTNLYSQLMQLELTENHLSELIARELQGPGSDDHYQMVRSNTYSQYTYSPQLSPPKRGKKSRSRTTPLDSIPEETD
ncbi:hypothetical protein C0991_005806 [Blastosporella zonata]|nr:hypothetical protein C0991_005806 [Blastosporella zonata]